MRQVLMTGGWSAPATAYVRPVVAERAVPAPPRPRAPPTPCCSPDPLIGIRASDSRCRDRPRSRDEVLVEPAATEGGEVVAARSWTQAELGGEVPAAIAGELLKVPIHSLRFPATRICWDVVTKRERSL